jgi:protein-tyrosine phosphatase
MKVFHLLFVCTGNICRSPTAEGIMRQLVEDQGLDSRFAIDSAGTMAYHAGERADARSRDEARNHSVDLSHCRARGIVLEDFHRHDLILAMTQGHLLELQRVCPADCQNKLQLFLEPIAEIEGTQSVPDPYYGGADGFRDVFDLIDRGCRAWLERLMPLVKGFSS